MNRVAVGQTQVSDRVLVRIGAVCAVLGSIVSVAAGTGFGNLTNAAGTKRVLSEVATRPEWYWPMVHLGFIVGALLWLCAFAALSRCFSSPTGQALGRLGVAVTLVGVAMHAVDSTLSGYGLNAIAHEWAASTGAARADLLDAGRLLLAVLSGTWAAVLTFFHGVPFVVFGLAVALDRGWPGWSRWLAPVAALAGVGSVGYGVAGFLGFDVLGGSTFVAFAVVVSLWMVVMGVLLWRRARKEPA